MHSWDLSAVEAPGGALSPVVLASEDGARVIAIVLQPGQELGEHRVRERAWLIVADGEVEIDGKGSTTYVTPGTLVTFDPGELHSLRSRAGARLLLLLAPWPAPGHYRLDEARRTYRLPDVPRAWRR
jgi:quercetin dioxygenase-like cupin family protein